MRRPLLLLSWIAMGPLLTAGGAEAAEWHIAAPRARAATAAARGPGGARGAAEAYLKHASSELGLDGVSLRYRNELPVGEHRTIRFVQSYAGLPVLGASAAVHVTPDNRVKAVVLDVARGLSVSPSPAFVEGAARKAVEASLGMTLVERPGVTLAVLPEAESPGRLVWTVRVRSARGGQLYLVDAHTGQIVYSRSLAVDVLGRVYPISAVVTPEPRDVELSELDPATPQTLSGWGGNFKVANYVSGGALGQDLVLEQTAAPNLGEDFVYDPPESAQDAHDAFAQVGIYYHLTRMRDYFATTHKLDMSSPGWKLVAVANMLEEGEPLDNAYFSPEGVGSPWDAPNLIAIGQGTEFDFSDDSDVFLHEFTHYVSHNAVGYNEGQFATTEYGLSPWGGSIDEGVADYFACTVNGDSSLGEASLGRFGGLRELSRTDKRCPEDLAGEVHDDGELIGSLAWSLREALGAERADKLVWGATTMLTRGASFADFARGLRMMSDDLSSTGELTKADAGVIDALVKSRGLDECDHVLDVGGGRTQTTTMFGIDSLVMGGGGTCKDYRGELSLQSLFHFKSTPAPGAKGLRFTVDLRALGGDDLEWGIYVRAGRHVGFSPSVPLGPAAVFDYSVEKLTTAHGEIVIDESSDPPFDPSQTYYMVIGHKNCPVTVATVGSADLGSAPEEPEPAAPEPTEPEPTEPEPTEPAPSQEAPSAAQPGDEGQNAGMPVPAGEAPEGCTCRAAGPSAPMSAWAALSALALAGAAILRRRDRRG